MPVLVLPSFKADHGAHIMSLSDLASIGSLVSGAAVLGSLIYLALQVQHADRNQQASIRHSRITRVVDILNARLGPDVADAWRHGVQNPDEITQTEVTQFLTMCTAYFAHLEDSFFQHEEGLLNEAAFAFVLSGTRALAGYPGIRAAWKSNVRPLHAAGRFRDFMDGAVARASREPPNRYPTVDEWRAAYAAETASA
jgi:hypothetical protein